MIKYWLICLFVGVLSYQRDDTENIEEEHYDNAIKEIPQEEGNDAGRGDEEVSEKLNDNNEEDASRRGRRRFSRRILRRFSRRFLRRYFRRGSWIPARRRRCTSRRRYATCDVGTNGCGAIQTMFDCIRFNYTNIWEPACNKYDVCYNCAQVRRWSIQRCHAQFLYDMKAVCTCPPINSTQTIQQDRCLKEAVWFHALAGPVRSHFNSTRWCRNDCVLERGSPYLRV